MQIVVSELNGGHPLRLKLQLTEFRLRRSQAQNGRRRHRDDQDPHGCFLLPRSKVTASIAQCRFRFYTSAGMNSAARKTYRAAQNLGAYVACSRLFPSVWYQAGDRRTYLPTVRASNMQVDPRGLRPHCAVISLKVASIKEYMLGDHKLWYAWQP